MDDYDEFKQAHERYMAHEDLYTKWANAALVSESILVAAASQMIIYRQQILAYLGELNTQIVLTALSAAGFFLSTIWLFTDWRNLYFTKVRIEVLVDLESEMFKRHKKIAPRLYGALSRELREFNALTTGDFSEIFHHHRAHFSWFVSVIGAIMSYLIIGRFSTRFRFVLIPAAFVAIWAGLLFLVAPC